MTYQPRLKPKGKSDGPPCFLIVECRTDVDQRSQVLVGSGSKSFLLGNLFHSTGPKANTGESLGSSWRWPESELLRIWIMIGSQLAKLLGSEHWHGKRTPVNLECVAMVLRYSENKEFAVRFALCLDLSTAVWQIRFCLERKMKKVQIA